MHRRLITSTYRFNVTGLRQFVQAAKGRRKKEATMDTFAVKWIFELDFEVRTNLGAYYGKQFPYAQSFRDQTGAERLALYRNGSAVIRARYAWDG